MGVSAQATQNFATALGRLANASHAGSTAIGQSATTTAANQVSLGGAGSSVRAGDIAASTAAQTGPLNIMTVDGSGTFGRGASIASFAGASQVAALEASFAGQAAQIATLQAGQATLLQLSDFNLREVRRANEGVAMALSMETPHLPAGATFAVASGVGYFRERAAMTASFAARVGPMNALSAGVGVGFNSGDVGARAGFQHAW